MGTHLDRFTPGSRIGDYVIERDLGDAYEAVHVLLPRRVLLEAMHGGVKPVAVAMMREAYLLEALRHPGVPRIFEVGMMNNAPWVASELVDGEPVTGALPAIEVLALVRDIADVLAHAHVCGVVHGDLRSIIRTDPTRGFPLVIANWREARADSTDAARADDILALGTFAQTLLPATVPARIRMMIDDLVVANPMNRPSAAEVRARAKLILETMHDDDDIIVEQVELIEIEPASPPPIPQRASSTRIRWTPALGVQTPPKPVAIGVLKRA